MPTPSELLKQNLDALRAGRGGSQGLPRYHQGPAERFARGAFGQLTAPLDFAGLAVPPAYGPEGPGVAGTIGELVGGIAPYAIGEAALLKFAPLLRSRALLPSALRGAATFGLVDFGRAPSPDSSRAAAAARGAVTGAVFGLMLAPKLGPAGEVLKEPSLLKVLAAGGATSIVPRVLGGEAGGSPVAFTGNETVDSVAFNAALAGVMHAGQVLLGGGRPAPEADETVVPPAGPISRGRQLGPRTFYQGPGAPPPTAPGFPPEARPISPSSASELALGAIETAVAPRPVKGIKFVPITEEQLNEKVEGYSRTLAPYREIRQLYNSDASFRKFVDDFEQTYRDVGAGRIGLRGFEIINSVIKKQILENSKLSPQAKYELIDLAALGDNVAAGNIEHDVIVEDADALRHYVDGSLELLHELGLENGPKKWTPQYQETVEKVLKMPAGPERDRIVLQLQKLQRPNSEVLGLGSGARLGGARTVLDIPTLPEGAPAVDRATGKTIVPMGTVPALPKGTWRYETVAEAKARKFVEKAKVEQVAKEAGPVDMPDIETAIQRDVTAAEKRQATQTNVERFLAPKSGPYPTDEGSIITVAAVDALPDSPTAAHLARAVEAASRGVILREDGTLVGRDGNQVTPEQLQKMPIRFDAQSIRRDIRELVAAEDILVRHQIERPRIAQTHDGQDVHLVRTAEQQADLEAKTAETREKARVNKGRVITLDESTNDTFRQAYEDAQGNLPGYDPETGTLKTAGLGAEQLDTLRQIAKEAGNNALRTSLARSRAALLKTGAKKGVIRPSAPKTPIQQEAPISDEVIQNMHARELSPEERLIAMEAAQPGVRGTGRLDDSVEIVERGRIAMELNDQGRTPSVTDPDSVGRSKAFRRALDATPQGRSGNVTRPLSDLLRSMRDLRTPILESLGEGKFKVAMPDETVVIMTEAEIRARIKASLPPSDVVPLTTVVGEPPTAIPVAPRPIEPKTKRTRPIPEPSENVTLRQNERDAGHPTSALEERIRTYARVMGVSMDEATQAVADGLSTPKVPFGPEGSESKMPPLVPVEQVTEHADGFSRGVISAQHGPVELYRSVSDAELAEIRKTGKFSGLTKEGRPFDSELGKDGTPITYFASDPGEINELNQHLITIDASGLPFRTSEPILSIGKYKRMQAGLDLGVALEGEIPASRILKVEASAPPSDGPEGSEHRFFASNFPLAGVETENTSLFNSETVGQIPPRMQGTVYEQARASKIESHQLLQGQLESAAAILRTASESEHPILVDSFGTTMANRWSVYDLAASLPEGALRSRLAKAIRESTNGTVLAHNIFSQSEVDTNPLVNALEKKGVIASMRPLTGDLEPGISVTPFGGAVEGVYPIEMTDGPVGQFGRILVRAVDQEAYDTGMAMLQRLRESIPASLEEHVDQVFVYRGQLERQAVTPIASRTLALNAAVDAAMIDTHEYVFAAMEHESATDNWKSVIGLHEIVHLWQRQYPENYELVLRSFGWSSSAPPSGRPVVKSYDSVTQKTWWRAPSADEIASNRIDHFHRNPAEDVAHSAEVLAFDPEGFAKAQPERARALQDLLPESPFIRGATTERSGQMRLFPMQDVGLRLDAEDFARQNESVPPSTIPPGINRGAVDPEAGQSNLFETPSDVTPLDPEAKLLDTASKTTDKQLEDYRKGLVGLKVQYQAIGSPEIGAEINKRINTPVGRLAQAIDNGFMYGRLGEGKMKAGAKAETVTIKSSTRKINLFMREAGIERTYKTLPNRHKTGFIKGEARAKGIVVTEGTGGVLVDDQVNHKQTRVKNMDEAAKMVADSTNNAGPDRTDDEWRSLFRRAFAGATSQRHRNNIRAKYALFSEFFPAVGEPLRKGETPLETLSEAIPNPRIPPTRNLTPPEAGTGGRMNLPPDMGSGPPTGGPMISDSIPVDNLKDMAFWRWLEPMKQWSLDLEKRSGGRIPAYTRIFAPLDGAKQAMQVFLQPYMKELVPMWKQFANDGPARERIGRYLEAPDKAKAAVELGISKGEIHASNTLRAMWNQLFKGLDYEGNLEFIENYLPWRRLHPELDAGQALEMFYGKGNRPKSYVVAQELERETNGEWTRQMDAFKLFHDYLFRGAKRKFMSEHHANALQTVATIQDKTLQGQVQKYVDRMWGTTDASIQALNDFTDKVMSKLGIQVDERFRTDLVSMLLQMNVGAHLAFRAPLVMRNSFQIAFVYPLVGEKAFAYGLKTAITSAGTDASIRANVIGQDTVPYGDEIFNPLNPISRFVRFGLKAYSRVDDYTRSVAYHATRFKVMEAADMYRAKNLTIDQFAEHAELDSMFHPVEAKVIKDLVRSGNIVGAADKAGYLMQENTNFIYRAGNSPEAFRGVAGRLFGQFGTWPISYIEYIGYLARFGSPDQRAAKLTRFFAMNAAFGGVGVALGVDFWKWLLFGPVIFTGGPMLQLATDIGKVVSATAQGRQDDVEAQLAAYRLKRAIPGGFIPGSDALRDIEGVLETAKTQGPGATVIRALTGREPKQAPTSLFPPAVGAQAPAGGPPSDAKTRLQATVERIRRERQGRGQ